MGSSLCVAIAKDKRKTKKKETILTKALPDIPEEVLIDILMRLPVKYLMRFKCVSKLWLSLIISTYFTNLYPKSSSSRQRLFAYLADEDKVRCDYALLKSSSSSHDHSVVSVLDQNLTIPGIEGGYLVSTVRGLLCLRKERRVRICNLNTRQVVKLPIIRSQLLKGCNNVWNYLGYDSVHEEYKVLTLVWEVNKEKRVVRSEYQVLVLGAGASWKKTQCHILHKPHFPYSQGMDINGVLYYGAWNDANRCVVMSFDLSSQELNLIELPNEVSILRFCRTILLNYKGKLAVVKYSTLLMSDGIVNLWVLEDAYKSRWSDKTNLVLPVSQMNFDTTYPLTMGTSTGRSGEVVLVTTNLQRDKPILVFMYHLERNEITRVKISPLLFGSLKMTKILLSTFWDYINIMYLKT